MGADRAEGGGQLAGELVLCGGDQAGTGNALRDQRGILQGDPDGIER
jgi:hypothetical protein